MKIEDLTKNLNDRAYRAFTDEFASQRQDKNKITMTLTFKNEALRKQANKIANRYFKKLATSLDDSINVFYGIEPGYMGSTVHVHADITSTKIIQAIKQKDQYPIILNALLASIELDWVWGRVTDIDVNRGGRSASYNCQKHIEGKIHRIVEPNKRRRLKNKRNNANPAK
jgi:hypothetical protein